MKKIWSGLKKVHKIIIYTILSLVILLVVVSMLTGPAAKYYIEKNSNDLIGRKVTIEKLRINPFSGRLKAAGLTVYETDGIESFVSFKELDYKMSPIRLIGKTIKVKRIHLDSLYMSIVQNGTSFNFDDMLARFSSDNKSEEKDEKGKGWTIDLNDIAITGSYILYKDAGVRSRFGLNNFNAAVPKICFSDQDTDAGITLNFDKGGSLKARVAYNIDRSRYRLTLSVRNFSTDVILPYLRQYINVSKTSGYISLDTDIEGDTEHILDATVSGKVTARDLEVRDIKDNMIFAVDSMGCGIGSLNFQKNIIDLDYITVIRPRTQFILYKDNTNNFTLLADNDETESGIRTAAKEARDTSALLPLKVRELTIMDGSVRYADHTLPESFEYQLSEITTRCNDFSLDKQNHLKGRATLGKAGKVSLDWKTNFRDMRDMNLTLVLNNFDIRDLTPYSNFYIGNNIENGVLQIVSRNIVQNNRIKGENSIEIFKPKLSKRVNRHPQYKLPVGLAVYVLTDRKGMISIDLPVSGDLSDPKFSYGKIIWQALGNVIVKVAAAPFTAIGSMFGGGGQDLDHVDFDAGIVDFDTRQYTALGKLLDIVKEKPELVYTFEQKVNIEESMEKFAMFSLKKAYSLRHTAGDTAATYNPYPSGLYSGIDVNSDDVRRFTDSLLVLKGYSTDGQIEDKAFRLFGAGSQEKIIIAAQRRNENLKHYFVRMGAPEGQFEILPVVADSLASYKGKPMYKIGVRLPDCND